MVPSSVIAVMLTLMVVMGIFPVIAAIVLLVTKRIKGSAFWIGVLMAFVSMIVTSVLQIAMIGGDVAVIANGDVSTAAIAAVQVIAGVVDVLLAFLSFKAFVKRSVTLKGGVSFGLGFGAVNTVIYGFSMLSNYMVALMINHGTFEQTYAPAIEMGTVDEETVRLLKNSVIALKPAELFIYLPNCAGVTLLMISAAVLIVRGINNKSMPVNIGIAFAARIAAALVAGLVTDVYIAAAALIAVAAAAFIYAMMIRGSVERPTAAPEEDTFLKSVAEAKSEVPSSSSGEYNPYE